MTPQEQRGRWLFLTLATLIMLDKLLGLGLTISGGVAEVNWFKVLLQPVGFAIILAFVWYGDRSMRLLLGWVSLLIGGLQVFTCVRIFTKLALRTPPKAAGFLMQFAGYSLGIVAAIGLFYFVAGLSFLASPSLKAFCHYRLVCSRVRVVNLFED
jgi:hypothetical protein